MSISKGIKAAIGLALASACLIASAGSTEEGIAKAISSRLGNIPMKITKSKFAELYEVDTPRGLAYTDKTGSFVLFNGTFVDTKSGENLSQRRLDEIGAFKFSDLPLADAIKIVNGDGSRVVVTIEDPNCGYCKRFASELAKVKNVTIYTFLYPLLSEDSLKKSQAVWCAPNRSQVWLDYMIRGKALPENTNCETPIERNIALAQRLRVMGTPALLFTSGERVPGFVPAEQVENKLAALKR